jgi:hypothetical protein
MVNTRLKYLQAAQHLLKLPKSFGLSRPTTHMVCGEEFDMVIPQANFFGLFIWVSSRIPWPLTQILTNIGFSLSLSLSLSIKDAIMVSCVHFGKLTFDIIGGWYDLITTLVVHKESFPFLSKGFGLYKS